MIRWKRLLFGALALAALLPAAASAEILAMLNYETKPDQPFRKEGIAIIDVDPKSANYGKILADIPLPHDLLNHHIFYNYDASKGYITALGKGKLLVMDMKRFPYRLKTIEVPDCFVGEDVVFSGDHKTWYLTCMGSDNVIVGDAASDKAVKTISATGKAFIKYPHGIAIHSGIDRMLVTSTVRHDLTDPGETVTVLQASTGRALSTHKVTNKPSPSKVAPVEVLFIPNSDPPRAYITNMFGGTISLATWNPGKKTFSFEEVFDFKPHKEGIPLEIYFNEKGDRLYVTTAKPGAFHILDIKNPAKPRHLKMLPTAAGAHHVAFDKGGKYSFVQNSFLNLPGMRDGSITVIDMKKEEVIGSIDTLKNQGLNPNLIVLLPKWNLEAGH